MSVAAITPEVDSRPVGHRRRVLHEVARRPVGAASLCTVTLVILIAVLAPILVPYDPNREAVAQQFKAPSAEHWLGTDYIGRDLLSRVITGTRLALEIALPSVATAALVGLALGLMAGYLGGWIDKLVTIIVDTLLSFPAIILALALLTLLGSSILNTIVLIAIALVPNYARLSRAQVLAGKQNLYVKAARSLGASRPRIVARHLLPNVVPPLLVVMALDIPSAIGIEAGLAFLGVGVQPPLADLGVMLNDGFTYFRTDAWPLVGPLVTLTVVTAAFMLLAETVRDVMDPKLGRSRRRRRPRNRSVGGL